LVPEVVGVEVILELLEVEVGVEGVPKSSAPGMSEKSEMS